MKYERFTPSGKNIGNRKSEFVTKTQFLKKWNLGLRIHVLVYFIQDELEGEEYKDEELFLFNLDSDPTEKINLASSLPEIVKQLEVKS